MREERSMARKKKRRQAVEKAPTILKVLFQEEVTPNRYDDVEAFAESAVGPGTLMRTIRGWRVAKSLDRLLAQVNRLAPDRSKASDGAIGDAKHQSRESDHNPWVTDGTIGVVTARDITNDPKHGCSAEQIANSIVASKDPRIKYVIWDKRICNATVQPWKWRAYKGKNPHTQHVHISVRPDKAKYDDEQDWQLTQAAVGNLAMAFEAAAPADIELAWGKRVDAPFKRKVIEISAELGIDPNYLMAAMAFESMRTFSASIQSPHTKATGLIQFMPSTAKALGTSIDALKRMTPLAQLDYVRIYFEPYRGKLRDLSDLYMAILWPKAVGKPLSYVLFAKGSTAYRQNHLDANNDGAVTKIEAASRVQQHLVEGMREELRG
jgi:Transglycosylase SLT domain